MVLEDCLKNRGNILISPQEANLGKKLQGHIIVHRTPPLGIFLVQLTFAPAMKFYKAALSNTPLGSLTAQRVDEVA